MEQKAQDIRANIRQMKKKDIPRDAVKSTLLAWYVYDSLLIAARSILPKMPDDVTVEDVLETILTRWYDEN